MFNQSQNEPFDKMLNVGCGAHFHSTWTNLDLIADDSSVHQHDIRRGLPYPGDYFDAVYHSHVLEHLTPEQGRCLLEECHRVLRPRGVLRIVVPDLEKIVKLYLEMLQKAWMGDPKAAANYHWMKIELLDQLVRHRSGGLMGPYMMNPEIINLDFVKSRVGKEFDTCVDAFVGLRRDKRDHVDGWFKTRFDELRQRLARRVVRLLLGKDSAMAFSEGLFRQQGEVHRWMYDRYSLMSICTEVGFGDFQICSASESSIDCFADYQLDMAGSQVRKPDSLFVECRKNIARLRMVA